MRGFWAVVLFVLGVALVLVGAFIWPFALVSAAMLAGAIATALWGPKEDRRPIAYIFAWTSGFILLADMALLVRWLLFYLGD